MEQPRHGVEGWRILAGVVALVGIGVGLVLLLAVWATHWGYVAALNAVGPVVSGMLLAQNVPAAKEAWYPNKRLA